MYKRQTYLPTSTVIAAQYGSSTSSQVPIITVDQYGRVTSASNANITLIGSAGALSSLNASNISTGTIQNAVLLSLGSSGTYGSGLSVPQISIDSYGRVTTASSIAIKSAALSSLNGTNITTGINASNITTGTLAVNYLPSSGVSQGQYGSSINIPILTVDQYGRITSASNTVILSLIHI